MNPATPSPDAGHHDEWQSASAFAEWLKDPAHREYWEQTAERAINGEFGELPPEVRASAQAIVTDRKAKACAAILIARLEAAKRIIAEPLGSMSREELHDRLHPLLYEATDELLDMPEPRRTELMSQLLSLRELVEKLLPSRD